MAEESLSTRAIGGTTGQQSTGHYCSEAMRSDAMQIVQCDSEMTGIQQ